MKPLPSTVAIAVCALGAALALALVPLLGTDADGGLSVLSLETLWSRSGLSYQIFTLDRLPRALAAAVVGAGLAAAGCVLQAVLRNPLAEPFTLGISSGSSLAAVLAIRLGIEGSFMGTQGVGLAALVGAAAAVLFVWKLGRVSSGHPPATLLLAGITIAMFCGAASMLVQYTANFSEVYRIVRWTMGGLDWIDTKALVTTSIAIGAGLLTLQFIARDLNALAAGSESAASLGVSVLATSRLAFLVSALVVGAGIALAGPIGFVGLMVPHALRALVGPDHRILLPCSALCGAVLLVVCDGIARTVLAPAELPVGVVTALLGGPFFLYLLVREKSRARLWGG